jgi:hypothetical protein
MEPAAPAVLRVSLQGPTGRHDLVVDAATPAGDLVVPVVTAVLGDTGGEAPAVLTRAGLVLDPDLPVADQGVRDGDLLVVAPTRTRGRSARRTRRTSSAPAVELPGGWVPTVGALVVAALALLALAASDPLARGTWCLALVLVSAAAVLLAGPGERGEVVRVGGVVVGAVALALQQWRPEPGSGLLALTVAMIACAVLAGLARSGGHGRDEPLLVLVGLGVVGALVFGAVLLRGGEVAVGWAVLAAGVLPLLRLLPSAVVVVPDDALLELDRLSVTAWSARERGRGVTRTRLTSADVLGTLRRGTRLHSAAALAAASVASAAGLALLLGPPPRGLAAPGAVALVTLLAGGQALLARTLRHRTAKVALLVSAGVCAGTAVALAVRVLDLGTGGGVALALVLATAGTGAVLVGHAFGRGWRSVRWARVGDGFEGLCVALSLPAALLAAGGWEWFRQLAA